MKWYKYDIRDLNKNEYEKWYSLMSMDRRARVDGFRFEDDKKRTVAGEMLARKAIAEQCGVAPESVRFAVGKYGKPYAVDLEIEFSVSHSCDMAVCAVDFSPVGIDIEKIRPIDLTAAKRVCNREELIYLFGGVPTKKDFAYTTDIAVLKRFFELWTAKEAYGKHMGTGLFGCTPDSDDMKNIQTFFEGQYCISVF